MNGDKKFEQIWGFRRNIDSSSDDSKSNSDVGHAQDKLRLVLPEDDRVTETDDQQHVQLEKKAKRVPKGPKKEKEKEKEKKNKREGKSRSKKDSCASSTMKQGGHSSRKKSKLLSQMTVSDDFRIFMESILDDLKVARETMFAKMRKEMDQLITSKPSSRSTKKKGSGSNQVKKPNQKPRSRKTKTNQVHPKKNTELAAEAGPDSPQKLVNNENVKESSDKNPILVDCSSKKSIFTNSPDQIVSSSLTSSSYLTLPLVLPNSRTNDISLKLERGNFSGIQGEERLRSIGHNSTESSCVGHAYPVGLNHHQRFDNSNSFGIPNRVVLGFSQDGNVLGPRAMNGGGLRYTAGLGSHTLPTPFASNSFRSLYPN